MKILGIDFGSKMAGTTAICYNDNGLTFAQSEKGNNADDFIFDAVAGLAPGLIFIDAPLSLPKACYDNSGGDFFYRRCDRELKAMSPMFLGGLTARAMRLKHQFTGEGIIVLEAYPRGLVNELAKNNALFINLYKTDLPAFSGLLLESFGIKKFSAPTSWHQCDALLAYLTGTRYLDGSYREYGDAGEGLIFV
jgi:predicted nuclease with RNAse H fold